jgi:hypothetical protein
VIRSRSQVTLLLVASVAFSLVACSESRQPSVAPDRWCFVQDANNTEILAVQEDNGTFDLSLSGDWKVTIDGPYRVQVDGNGTIQSHGHEFRWEDGRLMNVATAQTVTPGLCMFVSKQGELREELPFN